jgi:hypothetical protein
MGRRADVSDSELAQQLFEIVGSSWMTQAVHTAAELGLADHLLDGPKTPAELATLTATQELPLTQLLRGLCAIGVCEDRGDNTFGITPMGALLGDDAPYSVRSWVRHWGGSLWGPWGRLPEVVRTGESGRALEWGTHAFEHLSRDPEAARIFNQAMVELTRLAASSIVAAYDFSGCMRVMDVGGGYGELIATILLAHPHVRGVLFDMPHAIDDAAAHLRERGVLDRCELVAGSFFESVPTGPDVYLLKSILHDWNDERCAAILATCRAAMTPSSRLLVIERVMPDRVVASEQHATIARSDLNMLVANAAQERTESGWRRILGDAGFGVEGITPAGFGYSVISASLSDDGGSQ